MIIYKITNKVNGKMYIGQTIRSFEDRKYGHYKAYKEGRHTKIYDAMRKYGWDNFKFEVICSCLNIKVLNQLETFFIQHYDTINNGYNMYLGGDNNPMFSKEVYEKHSKTMKSSETRQKISKAMKKLRAEKGFSEETRRKISEKAKGNQHSKGCKRPLYAIEAARKSLFKSVYCTNKEGIIVAEFESLVDADLWWYHNGYETVKNYKQISNMIKKSAKKDKFIRGLKWHYK